MSYNDYKQSLPLSVQGSFYALIMAAMRNADTDNLNKLKEAWPGGFEELRKRYNAPGGFLDEREEAAYAGATSFGRSEADEIETAG